MEIQIRCLNVPPIRENKSKRALLKSKSMLASDAKQMMWIQVTINFLIENVLFKDQPHTVLPNGSF